MEVGVRMGVQGGGPLGSEEGRGGGWVLIAEGDAISGSRAGAMLEGAEEILAHGSFAGRKGFGPLAEEDGCEGVGPLRPKGGGEGAEPDDKVGLIPGLEFEDDSGVTPEDDPAS